MWGCRVLNSLVYDFSVTVILLLVLVICVGIDNYESKNIMDSKDKDSINNEVSSKYESDISLQVETVV